MVIEVVVGGKLVRSVAETSTVVNLVVVGSDI